MDESTLPDYLLRKTDIGAFFILFRNWLAIVLLAAISIYMGNFIIYILSIWMIGLFQFATSEVLLHEASHNHLFKTSSLNYKMRIFYTLPFFENFNDYKIEHSKHHSHLGEWGEDHLVKDYKSIGLLEKERNLFKIWFIYPLIGYAGYFNLKSYLINSFKNNLGTTLLFWIPVFTLSYAFNALPVLFMYWFVPLFWCCQSFTYWSEITDHYNTISGIRSNLNRIYNIICHNNGYHSAHHRYPAIPWNKLAQAHEVLKKSDTELTVDVAKSFLEIYGQIKKTRTNTEGLYPNFTP